MFRISAVLMAFVPLLAFQAVPPPGPRPVPRRAGTAQQPQQPLGPPGSVHGQIQSMTGEPVRKADVALRPMGRGQESFGVTTDASGVFAFEGVPPGNYMLIANRNGYVRSDQSIRNARRGAAAPSQVVVAPGQAVTGVTIKMIPHSVITGKVVDEDTEPINRAQVQVQRERWHRGRRQLIPVTTGNTNDLGEYRVAGLAPGRYYVSTSVRTSFEAQSMRRARQSAAGPDMNYTTLFYPNVMDPSQAAPVEVDSGQEARGIDFRLRKVVTHRVRGRVADATGAPVRNAAIMVISGDASQGMQARSVSPVRGQDGSFELSGIPSGSYTLVVNRMDRESGRATSQQQINVGNGDLDGVVLTLAPPFAVTGIVRADGGAAVDLSRVRLAMENLSGAPTFGRGSPSAAPDGSFKIPELSPGKYRISAAALPEGTYLKSVRQGPQEVLATGMQITGNDSPLEVVLGVNAPSVSGTVLDGNGKAIPEVVVALVPDAPRREQYHLYSNASVNETGAFSFRNVTPGEYKLLVLAASDVESVENPAFLAQRESRGTSVTLAEGKTETLQLTSSQ